VAKKKRMLLIWNKPIQYRKDTEVGFFWFGIISCLGGSKFGRCFWWVVRGNRSFIR